MGQGDGTGQGTGEGTGKGHGGDPTTGVLAGSIVACCFLFFMFFIGIPLFIAGVVLVTQANNNIFEPSDVTAPLRTAGIVCIVISIVLLIIGIILIVLTCCLGSRSGRGQPTQIIQPGQTTVVTTSTMVPGYPQGQPQGVIVQGPTQGYPAGGGIPPNQQYAPQGGYYPQHAYPSGQPYYDPNAPAQPPPYFAAPSAPPPKA